MLTPEQVIAEARSWIDVPYRHHGRSKTGFVDCIGLISGVGNELGLNLNPPSDYTSSPSGAMLLREARKGLQEITSRSTPVPGDIMVLWGWDRKEPQHFAICAEHGGRLTLIHAFSKRKKVVEHSYDEFWQQRLVALFRYKGMEV